MLIYGKRFLTSNDSLRSEVPFKLVAIAYEWKFGGDQTKMGKKAEKSLEFGAFNAMHGASNCLVPPIPLRGRSIRVHEIIVLDRLIAKHTNRCIYKMM